MILEQIEEMKKSSRWKVSERQSNISIESRPEDTELRRLDSSLKKNSQVFSRSLQNNNLLFSL